MQPLVFSMSMIILNKLNIIYQKTAFRKFKKDLKIVIKLSAVRSFWKSMCKMFLYIYKF